MKTFAKVCRICGCDFIGTGPAALYCPLHQAAALEKVRAKNRERIARARAASGEIKMPGVGKGGFPHKGMAHPNYKHGFYSSTKMRGAMKQSVRYCERCDLDLIDATHYLWVVHHKDRDRYNNDPTNLELLCKRCHQIEHECHNRFTEGATTIP